MQVNVKKSKGVAESGQALTRKGKADNNEAKISEGEVV